MDELIAKLRHMRTLATWHAHQETLDAAIAALGGEVTDAMVDAGLSAALGLSTTVSDMLRHPDQHSPEWKRHIIRAAVQAALATPAQPQKARVGEEGVRYQVTTGHCTQKSAGSRDCGLHNLHCNWPKCDERVELLNPTPHLASPAQPKASEPVGHVRDSGGQLVADLAIGRVRAGMLLYADHPRASEGKAGGEVPITAAMLADAFGCFWNAALDRARNSDDAQTMATVGAIVEGFGAVSNRLQEFATLAAPGADDGQ